NRSISRHAMQSLSCRESGRGGGGIQLHLRRQAREEGCPHNVAHGPRHQRELRLEAQRAWTDGDLLHLPSRAHRAGDDAGRGWFGNSTIAAVGVQLRPPIFRAWRATKNETLRTIS